MFTTYATVVSLLADLSGLTAAVATKVSNMGSYDKRQLYVPEVLVLGLRLGLGLGLVLPVVLPVVL